MGSPRLGHAHLPENPGRVKTKPLRGRLRRVLTRPGTSGTNTSPSRGEPHHRADLTNIETRPVGRSTLTGGQNPTPRACVRR